MTCDACDVTLSHTPFCVISSRKKKIKYNNLVVLPSHDNMCIYYAHSTHHSVTIITILSRVIINILLLIFYYLYYVINVTEIQLHISLC